MTSRHLFTVGIESSSRREFQPLIAEVAPLLAHVQLPTKLLPERR
jgi:hypothetical protein